MRWLATPFSLRHFFSIWLRFRHYFAAHAAAIISWIFRLPPCIDAATSLWYFLFALPLSYASVSLLILPLHIAALFFAITDSHQAIIYHFSRRRRFHFHYLHYRHFRYIFIIPFRLRHSHDFRFDLFIFSVYLFLEPLLPFRRASIYRLLHIATLCRHFAITDVITPEHYFISYSPSATISFHYTPYFTPLCVFFILLYALLFHYIFATPFLSLHYAFRQPSSLLTPLLLRHAELSLWHYFRSATLILRWLFSFRFCAPPFLFIIATAPFSFRHFHFHYAAYGIISLCRFHAAIIFIAIIADISYDYAVAAHCCHYAIDITLPAIIDHAYAILRFSADLRLRHWAPLCAIYIIRYCRWYFSFISRLASQLISAVVILPLFIDAIRLLLLHFISSLIDYLFASLWWHCFVYFFIILLLIHFLRYYISSSLFSLIDIIFHIFIAWVISFASFHWYFIDIIIDISLHFLMLIYFLYCHYDSRFSPPFAFHMFQPFSLPLRFQPRHASFHYRLFHAVFRYRQRHGLINAIIWCYYYCDAAPLFIMFHYHHFDYYNDTTFHWFLHISICHFIAFLFRASSAIISLHAVAPYHFFAFAIFIFISIYWLLRHLHYICCFHFFIASAISFWCAFFVIPICVSHAISIDFPLHIITASSIW